ncbi:poly(A) polymerase [Pacificibacter maritimus]|uniref:Poly(A) polymerase n=1 Tax=Pacificibacter maritimus TaxID=762213 RepID=A0A3N4U1K2_9RHOB|nr:CCA tRNA nucleotidyltransferase [Pacificibacter maritimus]RPE64696.1 poly(A) polymerase [Pacificibacter maritimus]
MNSVKNKSWFTAEATQQVIRMFRDAGSSAYFVGGCVRNSLMELDATDIDMATPLRPDEVMELAKISGLKVIPTGLEHGTVTVVALGVPFEITTFRRDVTTDGRRATVAFAKTLEQDASRRDFSINALYADLSGEIIDPLAGLPDLQQRIVRFIGDPNKRIKEDYLRILRFFRFYTAYGNPSNGLDSNGVAACAQNLDGLATLSRERIGAEMLKLLAAPDPCLAIGAMEASGVLQAILPAASGRTLYPFVSMEFATDPIARLAALGGDTPIERLKLSKKQGAKLNLLRSSMGDGRSLSEISNIDGAQVALAVAALRAATFETPMDPNIEAQILEAEKQVFPVSAQDLMPRLSGKDLGLALKTLHHTWLQSGFKLTKTELLKKLEAK